MADGVPKRETLEGWVVDQGCLRKYAQDELIDRARTHTKGCALMGHCVESGYGLVDEMGRVALLEPAATPAVVAAIEASSTERGMRLRVERQAEGSEMRTRDVTEI